MLFSAACSSVLDVSLRSVCFQSLRMQLVHQRDHGLGEELLRVASAALFQPRFQIIHARFTDDIIGIRHVEIVRGEKAGEPMLDNLIDDLIELLFRIALVLFKRFKPFLPKLDVVSQVLWPTP